MNKIEDRMVEVKLDVSVDMDTSILTDLGYTWRSFAEKRLLFTKRVKTSFPCGL